jgi:hypothetical protein
MELRSYPNWLLVGLQAAVTAQLPPVTLLLPIDAPLVDPVPPLAAMDQNAALPAVPVRRKADLWRLDRKCKCEGSSIRCGYRSTCILYPIYETYSGLLHLDHEEDAKRTRLKDLDYKFMFILALSRNPAYQLAKKKGREAMKHFPWRVRPEKHSDWLNMIPGVGVQQADLDEWVTIDGQDPLLRWIKSVVENPVGDWQLDLANCLVAQAP